MLHQLHERDIVLQNKIRLWVVEVKYEDNFTMWKSIKRGFYYDISGQSILMNLGNKMYTKFFTSG